MFTRSDYIDGKCSHREYYAQFVTEGVKNIVARRIDKELILNSKHESFSDIPLTVWDLALIPCPAGIATKLRECGDYPTLAGMVCVAKEAAVQIRALTGERHETRD